MLNWTFEFRRLPTRYLLMTKVRRFAHSYRQNFRGTSLTPWAEKMIFLVPCQKFWGVSQGFALPENHLLGGEGGVHTALHTILSQTGRDKKGENIEILLALARPEKHSGVHLHHQSHRS